MSTAAYITGRKRYQRPQAILWSEDPGTLVDGLYIPTGFEVQQNTGSETQLLNNFLILSDDNRGQLDFRPQRIEKRERTINGRMRSYHMADKETMSVSWDMLPSRGYYQNADFDSTGTSPYKYQTGEFTSDGGAGGVEILDWYENHPGPFWMFLAYDKYTNFGNTNDAYGHLGQYNQIIQVYFSDFNYSVVKRGGSNFDFWNISLSLEEV